MNSVKPDETKRNQHIAQYSTMQKFALSWSNCMFNWFFKQNKITISNNAQFGKKNVASVNKLHVACLCILH